MLHPSGGAGGRGKAAAEAERVLVQRALEAERRSTEKACARAPLHSRQ